MGESGRGVTEVGDLQPQSPARRGGRPVVVGEVLFDRFSDGSRVLGGAPFNVAWSLQAFGLRPLLITRVGRDRLGEEVLRSMEAWGLDQSGVQIDPVHPTGEVLVDLDRGAPRFDILPDRAWDHTDVSLALEALEGGSWSLIYHGTLFARSQPSRKTLEVLRGECGLPGFLDVNLRDPWWSLAVVRSALMGTLWIKLNEEELRRLCGDEGLVPGGKTPEAARELLARHALQAVVMTMAERGALVVTAERPLAAAPPRNVEVVDTVGAGDAFSAAFILGLANGWTAELTLPRALEFAAALCSVRGATTDDAGLYDAFKQSWNGERP
jgi:fructokinase